MLILHGRVLRIQSRIQSECFQTECSHEVLQNPGQYQSLHKGRPVDSLHLAGSHHQHLARRSATTSCSTFSQKFHLVGGPIQCCCFRYHLTIPGLCCCLHPRHHLHPLPSIPRSLCFLQKIQTPEIFLSCPGKTQSCHKSWSFLGKSWSLTELNQSWLETLTSQNSPEMPQQLFDYHTLGCKFRCQAFAIRSRFLLQNLSPCRRRRRQMRRSRIGTRNWTRRRRLAVAQPQSLRRVDPACRIVSFPLHPPPRSAAAF